MIFAMTLGFRFVFLLGAVIYLIAMIFISLKYLQNKLNTGS
jgi:hypothetical protein